jgi:sugar-phosphatase
VPSRRPRTRHLPRAETVVRPLDRHLVPAAAASFIFDLDGVIVDTRELVRDLWRRFAKPRGVRLSDDEIGRRIIGRRTADILVDVFAIGRDEAERMAATGLDDRSAEIVAGVALPEIPGASAFVLAAADRGTIALASSASRANVDAALSRLGLAEAFTVVIASRDIANGKPAPDAYLAAASALGVEPAMTVVFEDSRSGLAAARAAGASVVAIATNERADTLAPLADLVLADFQGVDPATVLRRLGFAGEQGQTTGS